MEVPRGVKGIDELSTTEALTLLDSQPDRRSRLECSVLLQAKQPKVARILRDTHGLSPRAFTGAFGDGFSELMELLPKEYDLTVDLRSFTEGVVNVSGWITAKKCLAEIRNAGERYYPEFRNFHEVQRQQLSNGGSQLWSIGSMRFGLARKYGNGADFEELVSYFTRINSQEEMRWLVGDRLPRVYPTPLRWSEGCDLGISDGIKRSEEKIVVSLAKRSENTGLCLATPPTNDGLKMLKRLGYVAITELALPGEAAVYPEIIGAEGAKYECHWAKVVYLPA